MRIVLFDGVCNLCSDSVQWIIRHDPDEKFVFASIQSKTGSDLIKKYNLPSNVDSVLLFQNNKAYTESSAALHIASQLKGAWKLLSVFLLVPPFIRNLVYRFIAKNRYKWFGKKTECWLPTPELRRRFIDS